MIRIGTTDVSSEVVAPTVHNMKVCACQDSPVGEGETQAFSCGALGRYLVVLLETAEGTLTLCEVEVFEGMSAVVHDNASEGNDVIYAHILYSYLLIHRNN